ncbi:MAG: hypothetical protein AAF718_06505 [Pseudomonadota bacterium]
MPLPPFVEVFPGDDGLDLPNDTGSAPPVVENEPQITLPPQDVGPNVVARLEDDVSVPPDTEDRPGFSERAEELAMERERTNVEEGEAATVGPFIQFCGTSLECAKCRKR